MLLVVPGSAVERSVESGGHAVGHTGHSDVEGCVGHTRSCMVVQGGHVVTNKVVQMDAENK